MPKEEWGTKRVCPTTGKRFYDLNKNPVVSPYTGETVEIEAGKSRMIAADPEDSVTKKAKAKEAETETEVVDEDDVDVELDDDLLDDEEDDSVSLDELADVASDDDDDS
ncbi:TIGR02300 family protein [Poseidonocella pacifica]|uniref:TIGR02300 family protein n=1 Tax=Poseidonocella pacifica TaxID=871651 RepID=A0A1I0Y344_9RHOB|nr:TIGR02300 family protein [Poseidonocella pacifica]SFB07799.1 TIGR02300 family protein [Poseidonocella pacifica]